MIKIAAVLKRDLKILKVDHLMAVWGCSMAAHRAMQAGARCRPAPSAGQWAGCLQRVH